MKSLVNFDRTRWKITISKKWENSLFISTGPCSLAMLDYQMVNSTLVVQLEMYAGENGGDHKGFEQF